METSGVDDEGWRAGSTTNGDGGRTTLARTKASMTTAREGSVDADSWRLAAGWRARGQPTETR